MKLVQVEFEHLDGPSSYKKLVWVEASWNLKPGQTVEFEGSPLFWDVVKVYDTIIESETINRKWGLELPKTFRTER